MAVYNNIIAELEYWILYSPSISVAGRSQTNVLPLEPVCVCVLDVNYSSH